ncbi:hypothetical protein [Methylobacterium sp. J-068]|uniref:hypothetical protein n=1 Tax=Methylobacterium sp. J-068 TaxID=2836649 RepID=UPI001FBB6440|nr:hypothetical protein [Methylobacterium sp. J-068]MCJ2033725.1 hypothetical protein [Methylobacterium sp. J-068]
MSSSRSLTSIDVSEYDRIESAMSESERGRWFLDEYLRRNRSNDTGILLDAIARLESVVTGERDTGQIGRLRGDVMDMAHAIARTKAEIAAIHAPDQDQSRLGGASAALDAIVRSTERATSDILGAAEHVQEAAWTLRESGSDAEICDELDRRATAIYTACSFQDLTAQRTARIIHTLRYLEDRLAAMMTIWGDALDPVPAAPGAPQASDVPADLCQSDVDRYIDMESSSAEPIVASGPAAGRMSGGLPVDDDIMFLETTDAIVAPPPASAPAPSVEDAVPEGSEPAASAPVAETDAMEDHADEFAPDRMETGGEEPATAPDSSVDPVALAMASAAAPVSPLEQTDVADAFAEIDALSEDEKRALFS